METLKHTKGNWRSNRTNIFVECKNPAELKPIATTFDYAGINGYRTHTVTIEEADANAKLICAAPDMLEILMLIESKNSIITDIMHERISKAINKAINGDTPDYCKEF